MVMKKFFACIAALCGFAMFAGQAEAVPVDIELVLAVDVSTSVDTGEFNLQRSGWANAINSAAVVNKITSGPLGKIAVSLVYWASSAQQTVGWMEIDDQTSADAVSAAILAAGRPTVATIGCCTSISAGIDLATSLFAGNGFEGTKNVIDVSGDGENNTGGPASTARDNALAGDTDQINGLTIGGAALTTYYQNNVIGGPGAFAIGVGNFNDFEQAALDKLLREISIPEPASLGLLGLGLIGLGLASRRRKAA